MKEQYDHKDPQEWAIILGGSKGLGLATAQKLAAHGVHIICIHRDRKTDLPEIERALQEIRDLGVHCYAYNMDALRTEKISTLIATLKEVLTGKKINILVHSIAKGNLKPMVDANAVLQKDDFQLTIQAMAISLYEWVHALHKAALFASDTRVISFTSEGNTKAWPQYAAVSAAKNALESITRSIALEYARYGIRANCIQAGAVDTESFRKIPGYEELMKHSALRNPYQRMTKATDVANAVYLLCRPEAAWINGCVIPVNGGEHLQ